MKTDRDPIKPPHPTDMLGAMHDTVHESQPPPKAPRFLRMKRKPPKGKRCDASVCVDYSSGAPRVHRCPNEATVEARVHGQFGEAWLCEDCAKKIEARLMGESDD